MPVVKGGVWTNIEDEILKASVSKYGLNQWARVSSLLARKTPKQCKARWSEWLDPGIRKIEWSKEEDEKLLHLAKLMPTQWRTIAPIVGRTATQCLERYQKLLDDAESRENDELGLGGPDGGENKAPSADDVRRLRSGELDPDPEAKPARPDTVDLDEDEKEMLSEARARLANTQGKKAKRKARERQLEESRRLASLQKRRELKSAGINIKITTRKTGQMDYNADIPFEKAPAPGFYDTQDEQSRNDRQRELFDPRKQQLANKRKNDEQEQETDERKRRKNDKSGPSAASTAAAKAGQMQKIREAERSSKRKSLNLPAPQVGESELEDIVKMGMIGERAARRAGDGDNDATRGLVTSQSGIVGSTPIRTPRAPQEEDRVANEIRNARLRTETQSALLGGDNPDLDEGDGTTGYEGVAPSKQQASTPNPLATPFRQSANGAVTATPMRTPRDSFRLNEQTPVQAPGQTPREIKLAQHAAKNSLKGQLAALPKPKETEWDFEIPDEQDELSADATARREEDAAIRDTRNAELAAAAAEADRRRQTQVYQRSLPRPRVVDLDVLMKDAAEQEDRHAGAIAKEAALLVANDARKLGGATVKGEAKKLDRFTDDELERARMEIALELSISGSRPEESTLHDGTKTNSILDDPTREDDLPRLFEAAEDSLTKTATDANAVEKKLAKLLGGYQARGKTLRQKMVEASETLAKAKYELETNHYAIANEEAAMGSRLERLREEVQFITTRERTAQDAYSAAKAELDDLTVGNTNGYH